jgi:hypothetical protein
MPDPWQKGGPSPNSAGRPPVDQSLRRMFHEHTEEAKERLVQAMRGYRTISKEDEKPLTKGVKEKIQLAAILEVLNRGIGKPKSAGKDEPEDPLRGKSAEEQRELLKEAVATLGFRLVKGGGK